MKAAVLKAFGCPLAIEVLFGPDTKHLAVGDWLVCDPTVRSRDDV